MAVRSMCLASLALASGANTVFEVGDGHTAVVRSILICNVSASARNVTIAHSLAGVGSWRLYSTVSLAAGASLVHDDWLALGPNRSLVVTVNAGSVDCSVFGAYLLGVAET